MQAAYNATAEIPILGTSVTEYGVALGLSLIHISWHKKTYAAKGAFRAAPSLRRLDRHPVCLRRRASALHKTRSFPVRSSFAKVNSS